MRAALETPRTLVKKTGPLLLGLAVLGCNAKPPEDPPSTAQVIPAPQQLRKAKSGATLSLQRASTHANSDLMQRGSEALELALQLPEGDSWNSARIGRAVLRQPDGSQIALASDAAFEALRNRQDTKPLALPTLMPGTSMIIVSAGTGHGKRGRDDMAGNHRFSKIIVQQADAQGVIPKRQAGVMQKTGQPIEIRPINLPMALELGDEMSIKVYEDQSHKGNAEVEVHHPDGEIEVLHTAANGVAHFEVRRVGVHYLRYETELGEELASAELTFSVPPSASKGNR